MSRGALPGVHACDAHAAQLVGHLRRQTPRRRFGVRLALGALAGPQPDQVEPGCPVELPDELLADHSGRAEDADVDTLRLHDASPA